MIKYLFVNTINLHETQEMVKNNSKLYQTDFMKSHFKKSIFLVYVSKLLKKIILKFSRHFEAMNYIIDPCGRQKTQEGKNGGDLFRHGSTHYKKFYFIHIWHFSLDKNFRLNIRFQYILILSGDCKHECSRKDWM